MHLAKVGASCPNDYPRYWPITGPVIICINVLYEDISTFLKESFAQNIIYVVIHIVRNKRSATT